MSRFQQSIDLYLSRAEVHGVCFTAIQGLRWHIASESEDRIACQEAVDAVLPHISPTRIVLSFTGCSHGPTRVMLNGAAFGSCIEQRSHVRHRVELLATAIEGRAIGLAATLAMHITTWCSSDWHTPDELKRNHEPRARGWTGVDGGTGITGTIRPSAVLPAAAALAELVDRNR
ncbi:MAG: hypothetical protein HWD60_12835 [Defluviicoccus sp.]|nr:MAG: hypothetical protein HWD60_12835 [Defluviicoccus sp.]